MYTQIVFKNIQYITCNFSNILNPCCLSLWFEYLSGILRHCNNCSIKSAFQIIICMWKTYSPGCPSPKVINCLPLVDSLGVTHFHHVNKKLVYFRVAYVLLYYFVLTEKHCLQSVEHKIQERKVKSKIQPQHTCVRYPASWRHPTLYLWRTP